MTSQEVQLGPCPSSSSSCCRLAPFPSTLIDCLEELTLLGCSTTGVCETRGELVMPSASPSHLKSTSCVSKVDVVLAEEPCSDTVLNDPNFVFDLTELDWPHHRHRHIQRLLCEVTQHTLHLESDRETVRATDEGKVTSKSSGDCILVFPRERERAHLSARESADTAPCKRVILAVGVR
jgi:hypothetical protein